MQTRKSLVFRLAKNYGLPENLVSDVLSTLEAALFPNRNVITLCDSELVTLVLSLNAMLWDRKWNKLRFHGDILADSIDFGIFLRRLDRQARKRRSKFRGH